MARTGVRSLRRIATLIAIGALIVTGVAAAACTGAPAASATSPHAASGVGSTPTSTGAGATTPSADGAFANAPCTYKLMTNDLPTWARAGFHGPPFNAWPYVTSSRTDIVGVLFGYPLAAPPRGENEAQNKILWVPKDPSAGELTVTAHLVGTNDNVDIGDISFGPSIVDVPKSGCWRFTLQWTGGVETVDIVYRSTR